MGSDDRVHRFGPFALDVRNRRLFREGIEVSLRGRAFDVLAVLASRPGKLVTKGELLDEVWSELAVEENNLQVQVSSLRRTLGSGWITTVPGRGYRFSETFEPVRPQRPPEPGAGRAAVPVPVSPLLGRQSDVEAVLACLRAHRLVSIVGPGGAGKTRLAQEAARLAAPAFTDGCAWVDLAATTEPRLAAEGVAAALGLPPAGSGPGGEALADGLGSRELLLVLDNGEHLLDALAPLADRLLARAPRLRILLTSQAPCRVAGEHVHRLGGLALPEPGAAAPAAAASPAVELFVARARALVGDFRLDERNAATVADLCRRLDGLPLALELAAGRLPVLGLDGLASRLEHRFRVLTSGSRTGPTRQRTLEALFDWSYGMLAPDEQAVFRRLGLLGSSFTLEQALAVTTTDALGEWDALAILGDLVDRSLLVAGAGEPPVYSLLESGRAYARSRLDAAADADSAGRALRMFEETAVAAASRSENADALRASLAALDLVALLPPGAERDSRELDLCLALGPVIQTTLGPAHPRAGEIYRRASELAAAPGSGERSFAATWGWWQFLCMCGRDREAGPCAEELVRLAGALGDESLQLESWHARLSTAQLLGDVARVVEFAERVAGAYDRERHHALGARFGGHDPGVCALGQGSVALWLAGRPDEALAMADRALELGSTMDHAYSRGVALFYASFTFHARGDRGRAAAAAGDLHALCERHAMDMLSNEARLLRGRARWDAGDAAGLADMEAALDTIDAGGDFAFAIYYTTLLASALLDAARHDDATRRLERVAGYALEGQRFFLAEAERLGGESLAAAGRPDAAAERFRIAYETAATDGAWALALRAATSAANHSAPRGKKAAVRRLRDALARIQGGATTPDVRRARRRLAAEP